jgi:hypothetical protein
MSAPEACLQDVPDSLRQAREYALLGNYEASQVYMQGVLNSVKQFLKTETDGYKKKQWKELLDQVTEEYGMIQDIAKELAGFKDSRTKREEHFAARAAGDFSDVKGKENAVDPESFDYLKWDEPPPARKSQPRLASKANPEKGAARPRKSEQPAARRSSNAASGAGSGSGSSGAKQSGGGSGGGGTGGAKGGGGKGEEKGARGYERPWAQKEKPKGVSSLSLSLLSLPLSSLCLPSLSLPPPLSARPQLFCHQLTYHSSQSRGDQRTPQV